MREKMLLVLAVVLLASCQGAEKNIQTETIKQRIVSEISFENPVVKDLKEDKAAAERLGIPESKIVEGFVFTNDDKTEKADEIVVIKAKDKKAVNDIERSMEAEITRLSTAWEPTDKKEYDKIQRHILKSKGRYVLLAICEDSKKVESIFNEFF